MILVNPLSYFCQLFDNCNGQLLKVVSKHFFMRRCKNLLGTGCHLMKSAFDVHGGSGIFYKL